MHGHSNTMTTEFFNDAIAINMCNIFELTLPISTNMTFPWLDSLHPSYITSFVALTSFLASSDTLPNINIREASA